MTPTEVTTILRQFNEWRRGDYAPEEQPTQPDPVEISEAIDAAVEMIDRLEAAEKERDSWKGLAQQFGNELDTLRAKIEEMEKQEPVAQVGVHKTGGNAGIAWSARPLNEFDSLPPLRDGDRLYLAPGAKGE